MTTGYVGGIRSVQVYEDLNDVKSWETRIITYSDDGTAVIDTDYIY